MQEQNYLVINKTTFATSVYECETQEEVKEIVSQLIGKGAHPASIRVTKEIPLILQSRWMWNFKYKQQTI
ncbi:hypothetical protein [Bacillus cytotoxicus]|uniref:hypothetical protein n=1 Tax=Bacillus cytotoxicus TaxID=580165 RepID=UPI001EF75004|nr:hypothetical protein [Bacillus cytotoxicus]